MYLAEWALIAVLLFLFCESVSDYDVFLTSNSFFTLHYLNVENFQLYILQEEIMRARA